MPFKDSKNVSYTSCTVLCYIKQRFNLVVSYVIIGPFHFFVRIPPYGWCRISGRIFSRFALWKVLDKNCNIIHNIHWILLFYKVRMALDFWTKFSVSSIPLSDFSNLFFVHVWIFLGLIYTYGRRWIFQ